MAHLRSEQQAARERAEQERAAAARRRSSPLYRVTPNERIVHEMLLSGQEGGLAFLEPGELEPEAAAAAAELLPPASQLWPPLEGWAVERVRAGVRALPLRGSGGESVSGGVHAVAVLCVATLAALPWSIPACRHVMHKP